MTQTETWPQIAMTKPWSKVAHTGCFGVFLCGERGWGRAEKAEGEERKKERENNKDCETLEKTKQILTFFVGTRLFLMQFVIKRPKFIHSFFSKEHFNCFQHLLLNNAPIISLCI